MKSVPVFPVFLYDLFFILFGLAYLPYAIIKGRLSLEGFFMRLGIFSKRLKQRFGAKPVIWLHAVSVGEVLAIKKLLDSIYFSLPDYSLVISTITKTGNSLAKKIFPKDISIIYLPFDISFIVRRVINIIKPKLFILCETEVWPNIILALGERKIPILLINGRISDSSFKGYKIIKPFLKPILNRVSLFCMQTKTYSLRLKELGVQDERVKITGNMKFDIELLDRKDAIQKIQGALKDTEQLFIAGSTHPGEEAVILRVYKKLLITHPSLRLLIAPRHIERLAEIERLIKNAGFNSVRISRLHSSLITHHSSLILLLDTIGELASLYRLSTIVFVGGSLVNKGGHNPIEPAIFEKPIISGPYVHNFKDVYELLLKNNAAIIARNERELFEAVARLLKDKDLRASLGFCAKGVVKENAGSTQRNLEEIRRFL